MWLDTKSTTRCSKNHSHFRCLKMLTADLTSIFFGLGIVEGQPPHEGEGRVGAPAPTRST